MDQMPFTAQYLKLFDQIWSHPEKLEDLTGQLIQHIGFVYHENSSEKIYFIMLYNIIQELLEDMNEGVLTNDRMGFQDTVIW